MRPEPSTRPNPARSAVAILARRGVQLLVVPAVASALSTSTAYAQACIGSAANEEQAAIAAFASFAPSGIDLGGNVAGNFEGPLTMVASASVTNPEGGGPRPLNVEGTVALEFLEPAPGARFGFSVCPVVGLGYTRVSAEEDGRNIFRATTRIPIGVGVGANIAFGDRFTLRPYVVPKMIRFEHSVMPRRLRSDGSPITAPKGSTEFGAEVGTVLTVSRIFGGAGVTFDTRAGSKPALGIHAGVTIP